MSDVAIPGAVRPKAGLQWPILSFLGLCGVRGWLCPSTLSAADAGPIETWLTFVLTQLLVFLIAFAPILLLFWLAAWAASRRRQHVADLLGGVTATTTVLLLLGTLAEWYGQYALHRDDREAALRARMGWEQVERQSEAKALAKPGRQSLSPTPLPVPSLVEASEGAVAANELEGNPSLAANIVTAFATQESDGLTEDDFDAEFLKQLERWQVATLVAKTALVMDERQQPFNAEAFQQRLRVSSVYANIAGMKVAVTKIAIPGTRIVHVVGLRDDEFVRVACLRDSDHEIPVLTGPCGTQVKKVFAIDL